MQQFDVKRGSRKCCVTEQLFGPGVFFYSALFETSSGAIRNDYSCEAWKDSPWSQKANREENQDQQTSQEESPTEEIADQSLIGWWKQRVPELDSGKVYWAPDHVLIAWFDSLYARQSEKNADQNETAWVMALLLMQKRLLARQDRETDGDILYLVNKKTKQEYTLHEPEIDAQRIDAIQNKLACLLYTSPSPRDRG